MKPQTITMTLTASSVNCLAASQSIGGAGTVTLNGTSVSGGIGTLDTARRVLITSAGNDSTLTWTLAGTSPAGYSQSETFAGGNGAGAQSAGDYKTVTKASSDKASASTVTLGTSGVGSSGWKSMDTWEGTFDANFQTNLVSGTANWSIQYTLDDTIATSSNLPGITAWNFSSITSATASTGAVSTGPITAWRLLINSGTGKVTAQALQSGGGFT